MFRRKPPESSASEVPLAQRVLDTLPQAIFWKDTDSVYLGCNQAFAEAVGASRPEDIVGKTDYDMPWPLTDADAYRANDREVIETRSSKHDILEPVQQADGKRLQVETTKIPLLDETARVVGVLGIYSDVTERLQRETEIREARQMLQLVLDTIPVRVFWKDRDSVYLGCNRLFAGDSGLEHPEALIGKQDDVLGWGEQADLYRADDRAVMESGESKIGYEEPQTRPDGNPSWLRTSKVPLRDLDQEIIGVLGTYEDITDSKLAEEERRKLQAKVQHAQKLDSLGILAGGIAHDFNNLLMAMLGHADLALLEMPDGTPGQQHVEEIKTAAKRARDLTNQMLAYSGKGRFVVRPLHLNEVVREMGNLLDASIPKKVELRYDLAEGLPAVEVDVAQIRQVVMNLVTNAAEAMDDSDGRISLTTGRQQVEAEYLEQVVEVDQLPPGEYVFLEVSDDGEGMDRETRSRIFEPFFTTKFQGRGLGLAAVQGIVRGHDGAIQVYSEPGKGSCVKVLFPSCGGSVAESADTDLADEGKSPLTGTILVVDDEEIVRNVTEKMLSRLGLSVITVNDGVEALEVFQENSEEIDLILLDMTMPRMDGEETFREMRRVRPEVKVILASGYNEQDATSRFVGKALAGFIQKPYSVADLEAKIREALD